MITQNDETDLATFAALHSNNERTSYAAWCKIQQRGMSRLRFTRAIQVTTIPWKPGDDVYVWSDSIDADGDLRSKVYGHIPAAYFKVEDRISERGE